MATYRVVIEARAEQELREIPFPFRRQVNQHIYKLKAAPVPAESEVDEATRTITILAIL